MTRSQFEPDSGFLIRSDQPLIGLLVEEDGEEMVRFFSEEQDAETAALPNVTQTAIGLAGAWSDLDWQALEQGLAHIRHESPPSPPLDL